MKKHLIASILITAIISSLSVVSATTSKDLS